MAGGITDIATMIDRMLPDLPGCPSAVVTQCYLDVMRDFCTQTECWQETLSQTLTDATVAYTLSPTSADADIRRVVWVKIKSAASDDISDIDPTDVINYEFNGVTTLTLDDDSEPTATVLTGLNTRVVLVPKINATTWDTGLMNRWADAIVVGVKARLMDNDKEGWGNPRRAEGYRREYLTFVARAKSEVYREFKSGSITIVPRSWL